MWSCPHCQLPLQPGSSGASLVCANRHEFDRAREGYVNLLPANRKRSREPGDSTEMIAARRRVHESGAYVELASAISGQLASLATMEAMLDLGCGEGFYLDAMAAAQPAAQLCAVDISRAAVRLAARRHRSASIAVASAFHLPLPESCMDAVLRVFAPSDDAQLARVLKPGGHYLEVCPGPRHLWQLREQLYRVPREHAPARVEVAGMDLVASQNVAYELPLDRALLADLVTMTPFAHRGQRARREALLASGLHAVSMAFSLHLFRLNR